MPTRLFVVILYRDFSRSAISYVGLFPNKAEIIKRIPCLSYNDLVPKQKKYKTPKSLFYCIEIPKEKKKFFNSYHLTDWRRGYSRLES